MLGLLAAAPPALPPRELPVLAPRELQILSAETARTFALRHPCVDDPTTFAVHWVSNTDNESAPHCVLARLPKTGGTSLTTVFQECVKENGEVACERGSIGPWNWDRGDVIMGQVRDPFSWYASLWGYLSDRLIKVGNNSESPYAEEFEQPYVPANLTSLLPTVAPFGSREEDRIKFREFVRLISTPSLGMMSLMMWRNYIHTHSVPIFAFFLTASVDGFLSTHAQVLAENHISLSSIASDLSAWDPLAEANTTDHIACWIRAENSTEDLHKCLEICENSEATRTRVNWQNFVSASGAQENDSSPRANNSVLYDEATESYVRDSDSNVFRAFGYSTSIPR